MKRKSIKKKPKFKSNQTQKRKKKQKTKLCDYLKSVCKNCNKSSKKTLCLCNSKPK